MSKPTIPKVSIKVSRALNLFCHVSVLFSDLMPRTLAEGVLGNGKYQAEHASLRVGEVREEILKKRIYLDEREWFRFARVLMRMDGPGEPGMLVEGSGLAEMLLRIV